MNDPTELTLVVSSPAFGANGFIPLEHAVEGGNTAPPLRWSAVPDGTRSVAVLLEDPDAPGRIFVHWIVNGIPPDVSELPAGARLPPGAVHGLNDRGEAGYYGPNPPTGRHRYFFKVFALDINLEKPNLTKPELLAAMKGHILARGEMIGTYERKAGFPVEAMPPA